MTTTGQVDCTRAPPQCPGVDRSVPQNGAIAAAFLSVAAGAIHLALAPEHLGHWWVFGTFFLAVGAFQLGYALVVLWRPTWPVALVGIGANVAIVLIYVASRTVGLPIVPPEPEDAAEGHGASEEAAGQGLGASGEAAGGFTESVGAVDLATTGSRVGAHRRPGRPPARSAAFRHLQCPAVGRCGAVGTAAFRRPLS